MRKFRKKINSNIGKETKTFSYLYYLLREYSEKYLSNKFRGKVAINTVKPSNNNFKDAKEFGYFINPELASLLHVLKHYKINSFIDLGCSAGILLNAIRCYYEFILNKRIVLTGIDNESELLRYVKCRAINKDLRNLEKSDIVTSEAVYFWRPFCDPAEQEKFQNNVIDLMTENQILITVSQIQSINHPKAVYLGRSGNCSVYTKINKLTKKNKIK